MVKVKLTPTQVRTKIVSVLRSQFAYQISSQLREFGRNKAWMSASKRPRSYRAQAKRIAEALKLAGFKTAHVSDSTFGGEYVVHGAGFSVTVNQDADTGNKGGVFIETVKTNTPSDVFLHDGYPECY